MNLEPSTWNPHEIELQVEPYTKLQIELQLLILITIVLKDFKHGGKECGVISSQGERDCQHHISSKVSEVNKSLFKHISSSSRSILFS